MVPMCFKLYYDALKPDFYNKSQICFIPLSCVMSKCICNFSQKRFRKTLVDSNIWYSIFNLVKNTELPQIVCPQILAFNLDFDFPICISSEFSRRERAVKIKPEIGENLCGSVMTPEQGMHYLCTEWYKKEQDKCRRLYVDVLFIMQKPLIK